MPEKELLPGQRACRIMFSQVTRPLTSSKTNGIDVISDDSWQISILKSINCESRFYDSRTDIIDASHLKPNSASTFLLMETTFSEQPFTLRCHLDAPGITSDFEINFFKMQGTDGFATAELVSKPGMSVSFQFLVVSSLPNLSKVPARVETDYWGSMERQLRGGHRGAGNSFTGHNLSDLRENTIEAFMAAGDSGADFVEFDVSLTKDLVPVVYHDLGLAIDQVKTTVNLHSLQEINAATQNSPVTRCKHLSQMVKPKQIAEVGRKRTVSRVDRYKLSSQNPWVMPPGLGVDASLIDSVTSDIDEVEVDIVATKIQPLRFDVRKPWIMPTLESMFKTLPDSLAFNLEVKWPKLNVKMESESDLAGNFFDINLYCDKIIKCVFDNIGAHRNLVFSSFSERACYCLRRKQTTFPVLLLTGGDSGHYTAPLDPKNRGMLNSIKTAKHTGYIGVNTLILEDENGEDGIALIEKSAKVCHENGLKLYCYGDDMQKPEVLAKMKASKLDGIIYDLIHKRCNTD